MSTDLKALREHVENIVDSHERALCPFPIDHEKKEKKDDGDTYRTNSPAAG